MSSEDDAVTAPFTTRMLHLTVNIKGITTHKGAMRQLDYNVDDDKMHDSDLIHTGLDLPKDAPSGDVINTTSKALSASFADQKAWERAHRDEQKKLLDSGRKSLTAERRAAIEKQLREWKGFVTKRRSGIIKGFILALPRDITDDQQRELMKGWMESLTRNGERSPRGKNRKPVAVCAIHRNRGRNPHAHVIVINELETEYEARKRAEARSDGGKRTRVRRQYVIDTFADRSGKFAIRRHWRDYVNPMLETWGAPVRLEVESFETLGITDRAPQRHVGASTTIAAEKGKPHDASKAKHNRQAKQLEMAVAELDARQQHLAEWETDLRGRQAEQDRDRERALEAEQAAIVAAGAAELAAGRGDEWRRCALDALRRVADAEMERDAVTAEREIARKELEAERAAQAAAAQRASSLEETLTVLCRAYGCEQDELWAVMDSGARAIRVQQAAEARVRARIDKINRDRTEEMAGVIRVHAGAMRAKDEELTRARREAQLRMEEADRLETQNTLLRRQVQTLTSVVEHAVRVLSIWLSTVKERAQSKLAVLIEAVMPRMAALTVENQTIEIYRVAPDAKSARLALREYLKADAADDDHAVRHDQRVRAELARVAIKDQHLNAKQMVLHEDATTLQRLADALFEKSHRYGGDVLRSLRGDLAQLKTVADKHVQPQPTERAR